MIKSILLLLKFGFVGFFNEIRILFKGLSEISISGFDNLNYHILQPIRLLRFEDVRDFATSTEGIIIITIFFLIIIFLISKKRF
jgi:hypothetical protein|tara:strand:- start:275 stop:526 length:252 start_codon:yes stop_codon:yes gene_type:complete